MTDEHVHVWKLAVHLDGCHFFSSSYACSCGATRVAYSERNFMDPFERMGWATRNCPRCGELEAGAKPNHSDDVAVPL